MEIFPRAPLDSKDESTGRSYVFASIAKLLAFWAHRVIRASASSVVGHVSNLIGLATLALFICCRFFLALSRRSAPRVDRVGHGAV